jgi:chromosome partitioning protein
VKSLAVVSQKGGVGKTSVSLNLAYAMACRGHRTLLVDTDPQGAIGASLRKKGAALGLLAIATQGRALSDVVLKTKRPELDLVLSGTDSADASDRLMQALPSGSTLSTLLADAAKDYALVLFDTPAGTYGITRAVIRNVDRVLVPLQAEPLAFRSVNLVLDAIAAAREAGQPVELLGFVLTMLQMRAETSARIAQEVWSAFPQELVLETTLPRDPVFLTASQAGVPLGLLSSPPPPVAHRFEQLAMEIEPALSLAMDVTHDEPVSLLV